jgi:hypothetical protein
MSDYNRILEAHALGVQRAYSEYRGAMKQYLDKSWFDMNGEFNFSVKCAAELHDAEEVFQDELRRLEIVKKLMGEEQCDSKNV